MKNTYRMCIGMFVGCLGSWVIRYIQLMVWLGWFWGPGGKRDSNRDAPK